jgi:hypothetical protein
LYLLHFVGDMYHSRNALQFEEHVARARYVAIDVAADMISSETENE